MKKIMGFLVGIFVMTSFFVLLTCEVPSDPFDKNATKLTFFMKSSSGDVSDTAITDTVGNTDTIGVVVFLTENFDSTVLEVTFKDELEYHFAYRKQSQYLDTIYYIVKFPTAGDRHVNVTGYLKDDMDIEYSAIIHVVERPGQNHTPVLTVSGERTVEGGETVELSASAEDSDSGQTVTIEVVGLPDKATFTDSILKWTTTMADTGVDTVLFIATDNGNPAKSDTDTVVITISATPVNHSPKWDSESIELSGETDSVYSLELADICTDSDEDKLSFTLLDDGPDGDKIVGDSAWTFTPAIGDTGEFTAVIVATDPEGATDTLTITLKLTRSDNTPPEMHRIAPEDDSLTISATSFRVKISCIDESGVEGVVCSIDGKTFEVSTSEDSIYAATITDLKSGWNTIRFIATDKSPSANQETLYVVLKYDAEAPDNIAPTITLVSPSKDTTIGEGSIEVRVRCLDDSGVSLVTIGGVEASRGADDLFTATIDGLVGGKNTITIVAKDSAAASNTDSTSFDVVYDNDAKGPELTLVSPDTDSVITNSTSYAVLIRCTDPSGVRLVSGKLGSSSFSGVRDTGKVWKVSITGLVANEVNTILLTVTDSSLHANKTLDTVYITSEIINGHTVTFDKNDDDATGTMEPQTMSSGVETALSVNAFVKTGWTFAGWATSATGEVELEDGAAFTIDATDVKLYAVWSETTHKVTFNKNDVTATGTMAVQNVAEGAEATLSANAFVKAGSSFTGWATSATGAVVYADAAVYTMGTADVTLFAKWAANTHKVTFDKNDAAATGTMTVQNITEGSASPLSANAYTKAGSSFTGWATSATGAVVYTDAASYTMGTADVTLYATWSANTHKVTFDKNDAAATGSMTVQNIAEGSASLLSANAFVKTAWSFTGWATSATGAVVYTDAASYTMGTADVTLFAKWAANTHKVTFDKNDAAATGTMTVQNIAEGNASPLSANAYTKTGSSFTGWATSATGAVVYADAAIYTMGTADVTLFAKWTVNTHTVIFNKNDAAATGTMANQTIAEGASATLTVNAFTKAGYSFDGWATSATGGVAFADQDNYTMGTVSVTLYAKWKIVTHTVTFNKNDAAATGTMGNQTIAEGTSANLTANGFAKTGSSFAGWATSTNGAVVYNNQASYPMGTSNVILYAKWTVNTHTVTFNKNDGAATGTMANQTIAEGSSTNLSANGFTKAGWTFAGWATAPSGSAVYSNQDVYTMGPDDVTLHATWTLNQYSLTMSNDGNGTTTPPGVVTVNHGAVTSISASAATGYKFVNWTTPSGTASIDNPSSAATTVVLTSGSATVKANFEHLTYSLSYYGNGNDGGSAPATLSGIISGSDVPAATPGTLSKNGYTFLSWNTSMNGTGASYDVGASITVTADIQLYAKWQAKNFSITFNKNNDDAYMYMSPQIVACGSSANLRANTFIDGCRNFIGWATDPNGTVRYGDQANYTMGTSSVDLYAIWAVKPLTISPAEGDPTTSACLYDPIILSTTSCVASFTWYHDDNATGNYEEVTSDNPDFTGAGTDILTVTPEYSGRGTWLYCVITDLTGNKVKSGTWVLFTGNCQ